MIAKRLSIKTKTSQAVTVTARRVGILLLALNLPACINGPAIDLAPDYQPAQFVVPDSWHGASPFVEATPSDGEVRKKWWELYGDPVLNSLEQQAMTANPDLQAAAERFLQARDIMMKARSRLIPQVGIEFGASRNKQSDESLFRAPGEPSHDTNVSSGGIASWEPDFWSAIRNETRIRIYGAEQSAAEYGLARLSLQAEIAENYFTLRGLDAQSATYRKSIDYYKKSLEIVEDQFRGMIASALDVARAQYLLESTQAKAFDIQGRRQVIEHAIAILANQVPAAFRIEPVDELQMAKFELPRQLPSTLLERRPDIASMERQMAQANRAIGIARAAFYPDISFQVGGGFENHGIDLLKLASSFWSYGSSVSLPIFQGGLRRARLQQAWSAYSETEDKYRSTVLNAFREVENGLSLTDALSSAAERQNAAVGAAQQTQDLSMELFKGGLNSSLDLIYAQVSTLTARIDAVQVKTELLKSTVALVRSLGGGWNLGRLPKDDEIQPFDIFQYGNLDKPDAVGQIDVNQKNREAFNDLTKPAVK